MTELDQAALRELLEEISERLRWAHEDLMTVISAGFGRDVIGKAEEDFTTIAAQHRLLLVALEQMRRSPQRSRGNGSLPASETIPG